MGDHQGRLGAANLGLFVGVDLNLWPTFHIADIALHQNAPQNIGCDCSISNDTAKLRKVFWDYIANGKHLINIVPNSDFSLSITIYSLIYY